jgi:outer membrane receptor protein involved in Fe transport
MRFLTSLSILTSWLAASATVNAQSAPAKDSTVVMDVFSVKPEEDPYRAAYSSAGTRYGMSLKELPAQVDVLTSDFIRDIGASDMRQALEYAGGIQLTSGGSSDSPEDQTIIIRGQDAQAPNMNGFQRTNIFFDSIVVGRIDVVKGPGGPLYGVASPGGMVSISSPEPTARRTYYFKQTAGENGFTRTEMQTTGPLTKSNSLTYVFSAAYQRADSVLNSGYDPMYAFHERLTVAPTLQYRFSTATKLKLSVEYQHVMRDNVGGNGTPSSALAGLQDGFNDPSGQPYGVLIPTQFLGDGTRKNRYLNVPDLQKFRFDGPDTYAKQNNVDITGVFEHAFSRDFGVVLSYNIQVKRKHSRGFNVALRAWNDASIPTAIRQDPRLIAMLRGPAPTPNAQGVYTPDANRQILEIRPNNIVNENYQYWPTPKAEVYRAFKLGPTEHRLVVGASHNTARFGDRRPQYAFDYAAARWANVPAEVTLSRFRSPTDFTSVKRWDAALFAQYPSSIAPLAQNGYPAMSMSKFYIVNRYANLESRFLNGRVITLLGFLSNRSDSQTRVYDPSGNFRWAGPAQISGAPNGFMRPSPSKNDRPSINTSFVISPDLTVYYNGQNTTQPGLTLGQIDGNGVPMAPSYGTNQEVGLHFEFWDKRIAFNASAFQTKLRDNPRSIGYAYINYVTHPQTGVAATSPFGALVPADTDSTGYDVKVDFRVTKEFRINASFANHRTTLTKIGDIGKPGSPDPVFRARQEALAATNPSTDVLLGSNPNLVSNHEAVGYMRYEFMRGPLKGLWLFGGAKYGGSRRSNSITIPSPSATNPNPIPTVSINYVPKATTYDFNTGYRTRIRNVPVEFALNVVNVMNYDDFRLSYFNPPRTVRLSTGVRF